LLVFSVGLAVMILTASNALAVPDSTTKDRGYVPGQVLLKAANFCTFSYG
jgi:hypothetical protein